MSSYRAIDLLSNDPAFTGRVRACAVEQAKVFLNDERRSFVALSEDLLRGGLATTNAFVRLAAAAPRAADDAAVDDFDQSTIPDADILAAVQTDYPTVAALFFDDDGSPIPRRGDV